MLLLTAPLLLPEILLLLETEAAAAAAVSSCQSSGSYAGAMACNAGAARQHGSTPAILDNVPDADTLQDTHEGS